MMLRKVKTESGVVQGLVGKDPRITVFRGIPYAQPPIGELRWKKPQPAMAWEGVRKCYEYGPMAMMRVHPGMGDDFYTKELHSTAADYDMSEDCLYLNVFSPAKAEDEKLPVLFYIHGGGLQDGYSYEMEFDGERLARRGIIVVTVGYRLGLFGFLAHPDITAETPEGEVISNFGMQDQSFALHWVRRNIAAFGGNPEQIVICGQSAGASSVMAQLSSPMNDGVIAGAICQSGGTLPFDLERNGRTKTLKEAEQYGREFLEDIGICSIAEARQVPAEELMKRLSNATPKDEGLFAISFGLIVDGTFLQETPGEACYRNHLPNVPMMVGHCFAETRMPLFGWREPPTLEVFEREANYYGEAKKEFLAAANAHSDADVAALYEKGDFDSFRAGCRGMCELAAQQGRKIYTFMFDHDIPGEDNPESYHGSDLWFMFDSLGNCWRPFEGKHYDLARQVSSYWVNFVKCGDPNGNGEDYNGNPLPVWLPYRSEAPCRMRFADTPIPETLAPDPVILFRLNYAKKQLG